MHISRKMAIIAAASTAALASQTALAQNYGSFGDNIADPGNIPPLLQQSNDQDGTSFDTNFPASPPGFGNRFSNGPTAAELLPDLLDFDLTDIQHNAVGNAFSDKLPVSLAGGILLGNGSSIPGPIGRGLTPLNDTDIASQVADYLTTTGPLGRDDFMLLYPSGNDGALALNTVALTAPPPDQAAQIILSGAQVNATNTASSAQQLLSAGAGTVLVSNLPNIGQTPAARAGGLSGQQLATLFSTTTNDALSTALSTVDRGNGTLIVADSFTLTNDIVANPGKYGFSDVTNPCSLVPSCVGAGADVQDQFLFWDPFFPTARGHAISAAFLADTVNAPRTVPALSELARFQTENSARNLLRKSGEGVWLAGEVGYSRFRRDGDPFAAAYEAEGPAATMILGWTGSTGITLGAAIGYSDMDVDFRSIAAGVDKRSVNFGAFASAETSVVDIAISLSYAIDNYDNISRNTGVASQLISADTEGDSFAIIGQLSRDFSVGNGLTIEPVARIGHSRADYDGFTETGATGLSQNISPGKLTKTFAELGAAGKFELAGISGRLAGFYHARIGGGTQQVETSLVSLPAFIRTADARAADRDYGRIEAEFSKDLGNWQLGLTGTATIADDHFDHLSGQLFARVRF